MLGVHLLKYYKNAKDFFKARLTTDAIYLLISAPIITAQLCYVSKNYHKMGSGASGLFGLNGKVIKFLGKWVLYILPAINALLLALHLASKNKSKAVKKKSISSKAACLSVITVILGYITFHQVKLARRKRVRTNAAIMFSILGASVGAPVGKAIFQRMNKSSKKNLSSINQSKTELSTTRSETDSQKHEEEKDCAKPEEVNLDTLPKAIVQHLMFY